MIKLLRQEGYCCPVIICDHCGGRCYKGTAIACWPWTEDPAVVYHLHKGACDDAFQEIHGTLPWEELERHVTFLRNNVSVPPRLRRLLDAARGGGFLDVIRRECVGRI